MTMRRRKDGEKRCRDEVKNLSQTWRLHILRVRTTPRCLASLVSSFSPLVMDVEAITAIETFGVFYGASTTSALNDSRVAAGDPSVHGSDSFGYDFTRVFQWLAKYGAVSVGLMDFFREGLHWMRYFDMRCGKHVMLGLLEGGRGRDTRGRRNG